MSIATKTGDAGTTALMFGRRVSKADPRVIAYGTIDELNAALGMVRATVQHPLVSDAIFAIQKDLVILMGELAVAEEDRERYAKGGYGFADAQMVERLTGLVDDLEKNHHISYEGWATPGATLGSATLDVARTTCRRAERHVVSLGETGAMINAETVRYLNRLSDLCWLWGRWVETQNSPAPGSTAV
jgi:cob(I)alamin adenosyltransferase